MALSASSNKVWLSLPVALSVWAIWLVVLGPAQAFAIVEEQWQIAFTMVFGSFVAGASSVGGGAVAFPVLTKLLEVEPHAAKLFSLAIQSVGMTSASILIVLMKVPVYWRAVVTSTIGGAVGISCSLWLLAPVLPTNDTRVFFTAIQAAFAVVLLIKLSHSWTVRSSGDARSGASVRSIAEEDMQLDRLGHADEMLLFVAGLFGGIASGIVGSGIDLVVFSILVLRLGISEKIATPTSVVIMAANSLIGMAVFTSTIALVPDSIVQMWLSAVPVVVIGAPLGAYCCARVQRITVTRMLICLISVEVFSTLLLIPLRGQTLAVAAVSLLFFCGLFYRIYRRPSLQPS